VASSFSKCWPAAAASAAGDALVISVLLVTKMGVLVRSFLATGRLKKVLEVVVVIAGTAGSTAGGDGLFLVRW
jgi:hypothetical protein